MSFSWNIFFKKQFWISDHKSVFFFRETHTFLRMKMQEGFPQSSAEAGDGVPHVHQSHRCRCPPRRSHSDGPVCKGWRTNQGHIFCSVWIRVEQETIYMYKSHKRSEIMIPLLLFSKRGKPPPLLTSHALTSRPPPPPPFSGPRICLGVDLVFLPTLRN